MGDESDFYFSSCAEEGMLEARSRNNDTLQIPGGADADPEGVSAQGNVGETMIAMHYPD